MLADVRVLEISSPETMLAGQTLGDLGADVIVLEPPSGAQGRRLSPFIDGRPGLDRSLTWHALNRNKRGVTAALGTADGRAILKALLDGVDIVIAPASFETLLKETGASEELVVCLVSNFSTSGPKAHYKATDRVIMAASSAPSLSGPVDRAPTFFPHPQSIVEAGAETAVAALAGLAARDRLGGGQVIDVQARIAAMQAALGRLATGRAGDAPVTRDGVKPLGTMPDVPSIFACKDGFAYISLSFSPAFAPMTHRIMNWLADQGALDPAVAQVDIAAVARQASLGQGSADAVQALIDGLTAQLLKMTKSDIADVAYEHRLFAAPIMNMEDIANFRQYRERGLFAQQQVGEVVVDVPARFSHYSDYQIEVHRPAPGLSEHSAEILSEYMGLDETELQALFEQGII